MAPGPQLAGTGEALDASLNTIISEFFLLRDEEPLMRMLARQYALQPHTGRSKVTLDYGRLVARDLTDGIDIVEAQDLSDAQNTYSPSEVGLKVILPRTTVRRVADPDLMRQVGRMMAAAYNLKEDTDGTGQFSSLTAASLGTAGDILAPGHISAMAVTLQVGGSIATPEPAPEPIHGVFHPCTLHQVMMRMVPMTDVPTGTTVYTPSSDTAETVGAGTTETGQRILQRGLKYVKVIAGAQIHMSANISVDSSNDAISGMFSKEGLIYVSEFEPEEDTEKDASLRGKELVITGSYAWGVHRAGAYGGSLTFDAILPTS